MRIQKKKKKKTRKYVETCSRARVKGGENGWEGEGERG